MNARHDRAPRPAHRDTDRARMRKSADPLAYAVRRAWRRAAIPRTGHPVPGMAVGQSSNRMRSDELAHATRFRRPDDGRRKVLVRPSESGVESLVSVPRLPTIQTGFR